MTQTAVLRSNAIDPLMLDNTIVKETISAANDSGKNLCNDKPRLEINDEEEFSSHEHLPDAVN